jgi:hypothetical protein
MVAHITNNAAALVVAIADAEGTVGMRGVLALVGRFTATASHAIRAWEIGSFLDHGTVTTLIPVAFVV